MIGLDLSHQDLKTAQSRIADMASYNPKGSVDFAQANGLSLPLADHSVDRLICSEVLEHIPNYIGFLEEIDRVLKPDGRLCISVPRSWPERCVGRFVMPIVERQVAIFEFSMPRTSVVKSSVTH